MAQVGNQKPRRYASNAIQQRRARVVAVLRKLIVEKGVDGFTLAEVARQAQVSERTIYNIGKTKSDLVGQAVQHYQQELASEGLDGESLELDQVLESLAKVSARLIPERNWAETIARLYFSGSTSREIYLSLVAISASHLTPAVNLFLRRGELAEAAPVELVAHHFADTAFGILNDWALGRIADLHLSGHLQYALLAALTLLISDEARQEVLVRMAPLAILLSGTRR